MKKYYSKILPILLNITIFLPFLVNAQKIQNPLQAGDLYEFLIEILTELSKIGAVVVVVMIIYSGFLYVTAQGNEQKIKDAHKAILYTVIGAAIILGATLIAMVIKNTISQLQ